VKKNTGHNFTTWASNQFTNHMQLKSFYQDESLTQACATLASNKTIRCKPPTILPSCQELVVLTE
jgi:hypothetical protein